MSARRARTRTSGTTGRWSWLVVEMKGLDGLLLPTYGPPGQSRAEAHADVARLLSELPPDADPVRAKWAAGAKDDTVYYAGPGGMLTFALVPYATASAQAQLAAVQTWLDDYVQIMGRSTGLDVKVSWV